MHPLSASSTDAAHPYELNEDAERYPRDGTVVTRAFADEVGRTATQAGVRK